VKQDNPFLVSALAKSPAQRDGTESALVAGFNFGLLGPEHAGARIPNPAEQTHGHFLNGVHAGYLARQLSKGE
jgi:hypothetical protein